MSIVYNIIEGGTIVIALVVITIGILHMSNKPHPGIWNFALFLILSYVVWLMILFVQTADNARQFLTYHDSELGIPLPERNYAQDCRIYTPKNPDGPFANIADKMDIFVIAHLYGWYLKTLIIRDFWLLTIISIGFELMEYTLECQLPNFGECWWDHWILDFVICNGLGIYLGIKTCEYLSLEWMLQELSGFYFKTALWIPPNHILTVSRQMLFGFCSARALNEMYHILESNLIKSKSVSISFPYFALSIVAALVMEVLIVVKFGWETIAIPLPRTAIVGWSLFFIALVMWTLWKFAYPMKDWPIIGHFIINIRVRLCSLWKSEKKYNNN